MLNQEDLKNLYNIISDENKSFETIGNIFQKTYQKHDQFKVGVSLWYLIKDGLLTLPQRLAGFYIYYEMYKNENISYKPFIPIVLETLETSNSNIEKKFLLEFVTTSNIKQVKLSVKAYIDENKYIDTVLLPDLKQFWQVFYDEKEKISNVSRDWVRPVIYESNDCQNRQKEGNTPFDFSTLSSDELSFNFFEPNYMTFYPNSSFPFYEDEPIWIMPGLNFDFIWDFTLSPEQNTSKYSI